MKFFFDMFSNTHFRLKTMYQIKVENFLGAVKSENDPEYYCLFIFSKIC